MYCFTHDRGKIAGCHRDHAGPDGRRFVERSFSPFGCPNPGIFEAILPNPLAPVLVYICAPWRCIKLDVGEVSADDGARTCSSSAAFVSTSMLMIEWEPGDSIPSMPASRSSIFSWSEGEETVTDEAVPTSLLSFQWPITSSLGRVKGQ